MSLGTVVALGPWAYKDYGPTNHIEIGDTVTFLEYGGRAKFDDCDDPDKDPPSLRYLNDVDIYAVKKRQE